MEMYYSDSDDDDDTQQSNFSSDSDEEEKQILLNIEEAVQVVQNLDIHSPVLTPGSSGGEYVIYPPTEDEQQEKEQQNRILQEKLKLSQTEALSSFLNHINDDTESMKDRITKYSVHIGDESNEYVKPIHYYEASEELSKLGTATAIKRLGNTIAIGTDLGIIIIFGLNGETPYPIGSNHHYNNNNNKKCMYRMILIFTFI
jgi:hypothetical protein